MELLKGFNPDPYFDEEKLESSIVSNILICANIKNAGELNLFGKKEKIFDITNFNH